MKIDLTKVSGCYSKELRQNCDLIKQCLKEPSVTLDEMKNVVRGILELAYIDVKAKPRFLKQLADCMTKQEVDQLCYGAVRNGMNFHTGRPRRKACTY